MPKVTIAVDQYDKEGNFLAHYESIAKAEDTTGISINSIIKACRGINKTSGGYIWKYSDPERATSVPKRGDFEKPLRTFRTDSGCNNGYQELANAIIQSAATDYRKVIEILNRRPDLVRLSKVQELERFFHSNWFGTLTSVDGDYILKKIKEEVIGKGNDN